MANPLIDQGTLNRIRGSVTWDNFPTLNVTAPYLGEEGIGLTLDGETTVFIPTMTGATTSPEPYMMCTLTMALLKTQPLSAAYKQQMETLSQLGNCTVRPDAKALGVYPLINCAIQGVGPLRFNGKDAGWGAICRGYYLINSSLFD